MVIHRSNALLLMMLLSMVALLGGGCQSWSDYTITKRGELDKAIATARAETESKLTALKEQETKALKDTIATHLAREQQAADYLFKGSAVFGTLKAPTRPELVMGQSIQQTATQLPPATSAAQAAAFKALQTELDETKISTQALKEQYERELGIARAEGEAKAKALADLNSKVQAVETEKARILNEALAKEQQLQAAKDEVQDKSLALKTKEAEEAKSVQAIKLKMSSIVGGLALLCLAGAIWSPIGKEKFGLGAAILGLAAVAIWYIQPWMVTVAVGVSVLGLIGWAARKGYIESQAATNVFRAIQEVKTTSKEEYDKVLRPKLQQWMTKYDPKTGKPVPDTAAIQHVDEVLRKAGDL